MEFDDIPIVYETIKNNNNRKIEEEEDSLDKRVLKNSIENPDDYIASLEADMELENLEQEAEDVFGPDIEPNIENLPPVITGPSLSSFELNKLEDEGFNPQQLDVIKSNYPIVNIAGPGSGKTKTLIAKITTQVNSIEDLKNTLVLTFTNAASNEILERLSGKLGSELNRKDFYAGTFHGMFYKILKENIQILNKMGFTDYPRILDSNEDKHLFEKVIQTYLNKDGKMKKTDVKDEFFLIHGMYPLDIYYTINHHINGIPGSLDTIKETVKERSESQSITDLNILDKIVDSFFKTKLNQNNLSFTDILMYTYFALRDFPEMREKVQDQFDYMLVDEYQDTNPIQAATIDLIDKNNSCLIGDPYQSIYKFLGARVKNIMNKTKEEGMNVIQLVKNYRSTENIVSFTNDIASLFTEKVDGYIGCESANMELNNFKIELKQNVHQEFNILSGIEYRIKKGVPLSEIAVLSRTKNDTFLIEKMLKQKKIPFIKKGGNELYDTKEVKFLINIAKVLTGQYSPENIESITKYFQGLGAASIDKVTKIFIEEQEKNPHITFQEIIERDFPTNKSLTNFSKFLFGTNKQKPIEKGLFDLEETTQTIEDDIIERNCNYETFLELIESPEVNFKEDLLKKAETVNRRREIEDNIEYFKTEIKKEFQKGTSEDLIEYLSDISLDNTIEVEEGEIPEAITISTAHSSKGLEWNSVFILNAEDGKFPSYKALNPDLEEEERLAQIEEEKRLLYVAVSRAKEHLTVTSSGNLNQFISKFLDKPYVNLYTGKPKTPWNGRK